MSILQIPRIYFRGNIAWDPVTTNNYPVEKAPAAYDEADCVSVLEKNPVSAADVTAYRQSAVDNINSLDNWNPHGTYRSPFYETAISGVDTGSGVDIDDKLVGAPVSFTGMLVDCEPYGAFSSQLFFDDISFGIQGGCRIFGKRQQHFTDRFINFAANPLNDKIAGVASVMWQTCFDKDGFLEIDAFDSKALQALEDAVSRDDVLGLMVRFVTFRTVYYGDPELSNGSEASTAAGKKLQAEIAAGGFQPNPARSNLVGTVGLWSKDECPSESSDRCLAPTGMPIEVSPQPNAAKAQCGTGFAYVGEKSLALDFSNVIPWSSRDAQSKAALGDLTIFAADPAGGDQKQAIATIPASSYSQDAYDRTSGIIDLPLSPDVANSLAGRNLSVVVATGGVLLDEEPYRAIPDDPNFYTDEYDQAITQVRTYLRGRPVPSGVEVFISQMNATDTSHVVNVTNDDGYCSFTLPSSPGSVTGWIFQATPDARQKPPTLPVGKAFNPMSWTYMYHRILPADDDIAALDPTWENVHGHVLANWEAMAPCMDNWLRLGDEKQVKAYGPLIKRLTSPGRFEDFRYMPITRDLTRGQRTLLYNFLDGTYGNHAEAFAVGAKAMPEQSELTPDTDSGAEPTTEIGRLSRSHRSG